MSLTAEPLTVMDAAERLADAVMIYEIEMKVSTQRRLDSQGCDEDCGLCGNPAHPICFWHEGAKAAWPRRMA